MIEEVIVDYIPYMIAIGGGYYLLLAV